MFYVFGSFLNLIKMKLHLLNHYGAKIDKSR